MRFSIQVTHTVENGGILKTSIRATATKKTPIMLTQHIYWNLDAFQGSDNILKHKLRVDSSRVVAVDGDAIPTGDFINVTDTPFDFRTVKSIDWDWDATPNLCGGGPSDARNVPLLPASLTILCRMRRLRSLFYIRYLTRRGSWCLLVE